MIVTETRVVALMTPKEIWVDSSIHEIMVAENKTSAATRVGVAVMLKRNAPSLLLDTERQRSGRNFIQAVIIQHPGGVQISAGYSTEIRNHRVPTSWQRGAQNVPGRRGEIEPERNHFESFLKGTGKESQQNSVRRRHLSN